ncbi:MAG: glycosyltransferase [Imperialibacter sp.]|uniref:glycosyltransferase n=1 Tax=Imperialibacter sp. TaxID=2038411 RepID=UPI0032EBA65A
MVCCYNSAIRMPETLRHLARQQVPAEIPWEVVVVNNKSTDDTVAVAEAIWRECGSATAFVVVDQPIPGLSFAREKGIEAAQYEYLLYCDDDNWLAPDYVATVFNLMKQDTAIGALGGKGFPHFEISPPLLISLNPGPYAVGAQGTKSGYLPVSNTLYGAATTYRRSALHQLTLNGFSFQLTGRLGKSLATGEDRELGYALSLAGFSQYYSEDLMFVHFIQGSRISKTYYYNLLRGNCYSFPVLHAYYSLIQEKFNSRPRKKAAFVWSFFLYQFLQFRKVLKMLFFSREASLPFFFCLELWLTTSSFWLKKNKLYTSIIKQTRSKNYYAN